MTFDDISRLQAGLDEDERIARAAIESELPLPIGWRDPQTPRRWKYFEYEEDGRTHGQVRSALDLNIHGRGSTNEQKRQIARQDPKATLDRVEAIRKVIADVRDPDTFDDHLSGGLDYTSFREGVAAAADLFITALASIYPADETEGTQP